MRGCRKLWQALAACYVGLGAMSAQAGLFDDDEARLRIESLRQEVSEHGKRIDVVTTTAANATSGQLDLANQIEQLKADMARLRGQTEVLTYDLDTAQKRQKDFYVDLDNRLRKIEAAVEASAADVAGAAGASAPEQPVRDPAAEARDYEAALTFFKASKFKEALAAFEGFIGRYERSTLFPSAHFWAASARYQLHDYLKAAEMFGKVSANWPADAKAADALLAQANCYREAGNPKAMRKVLELLVNKYPATPAAQTARGRLQAK